MPPSDEKVGNDGSNNRISNMPLLFADGYPTSLNKITEAQLEKFIPFMVQCSLGHIKINSLDEFREPEWWPKELEFTNPFKRPKSFTGNWLHMMKQIVVECYSFHDCVYLLRYCNDLASYQPISLRFINNYNSTTSLYERSSNKLLVTFRNENMLYDQEQKINSRKCLLPKQSNSQYNQIAQEDMAILEGFDIYLCDNCDAELYSYGALVEHERSCRNDEHNQEAEILSDDDDVIFCGEVFDEHLPLGWPSRARTEQQKQHFLAQNFALASANTSESANGVDGSPNKARGNSADLDSAANELSPGKHRRLPRRTRYVMTLGRCPQIPLSSPLGQSLVKSTKATCTPDYATERLERLDRFCHAPTLPPGTGFLLRQQRTGHEPLLALDRRLPKWLYNKPRAGGSGAVPVTYKRPADEPIEHYHDYKFPRRQYSKKHRMENFYFYNKPLIKRCRPCSIRLKRLTPSEMRFLVDWPGIERRKRETELAAELERQRRKEAAAQVMVIDSIDLCSSEEEEDEPIADAGGFNEPVSLGVVIKEMQDSTETESIRTDESRSSSSLKEGNMDMNLETIVLEADDADVVARSSAVPAQQKQSSNSLKRSIGTTFASSLTPFHGTLLSEGAIRLNKSQPTIAAASEVPVVRSMFLYNCSRTTVNVGAPAGATVPDSNRLLKENRANGWMPKGIAHASVGLNSTPLPVMGQAHTMHLATPNVRALFPVSFTNGPVGVQSHVGTSVVQTLTSTTFVNQTVHKRQLSVTRTSGPTATVVTGSVTAANLQQG